jgi:hypothetical protein
MIIGGLKYDYWWSYFTFNLNLPFTEKLCRYKKKYSKKNTERDSS